MPMIMWSKYLDINEWVRVEVLALGDIHSVGGFEVVARHDVVDVVDSSCPEPDLEEVSGPDPSIRIFGLVLREVGRINVVMDVPVALVPLLVVVLLEVVMGRVDCEVLAHPGCQLQLLVCLIQQHVVFLGDHSVAVAAVAAEHLEAYIMKGGGQRLLE